MSAKILALPRADVEPQTEQTLAEELIEAWAKLAREINDLPPSVLKRPYVLRSGRWPVLREILTRPLPGEGRR